MTITLVEHTWTQHTLLAVGPSNMLGLVMSACLCLGLRGKWDRDLAHNSDYDVAKTLELVLRL